MDSSQNLTTGNPVGDINREFEEREAQDLATKLQLNYIDLSKFPINPEVLQFVSESEARSAELVPFFRSGFKLRLAAVNPEDRVVQKIVNRLEVDRFEIEMNVCSENGLNEILKHYGSKLINRKKVELKEQFDEKDGKTFEEQFIGLGDLETKLKNLQAQEALNEIEITALQVRASDIHIQPYEEKGLLRFRINGILHDICPLPKDRAEKLVSHIKYIAGMKSNIFHIPQDGHISFRANNRDVDLRVSTLPTEFFESVVMRVLDSRKGIKTFSDLGFEPHIESSIRKAIGHKNGMVLVTGPTGSGKTTTLYSMLAELNEAEKKLVTLEDPIEYHLDNVTQSQVDENSEYNFSNGLKALLRHDPDVILIGEIRELSTAKLAAEASLTGHVVFSSLHTNSALGAITRLNNLGLEYFNIAAAINAIFAQRLVRKICPHCRKKVKFDLNKHPEAKEAFSRVIEVYPDILDSLSVEVDEDGNIQYIHIYEPQGCEKCSHTGFVDQTVICETVDFSDELRARVAEGLTEIDLREFVAKTQPYYLTLFEDGFRKVLLGETTLEEVYRVAG